jgi:hypothetical protein
MGVFDPKQNSSEYSLLNLVVEGEVELTELFADETDSEYRHFLDY